jgi:hypothetical protein
MSKASVILRVCSFAAATVLSGIVLGRLATRAPSPRGLAPEPTVQAKNSSAAFVFGNADSVDMPTPPSPSRGDQFGAGATYSASLNQVTNWNESVADILGSESDEKDKRRQLLEVFPSLPQDGQVQVAEHLSRLLPKQDYAALGQYLTNATTPGPVLDVLMADLLNRPDTLKLPYLLQIARDDRNPKAGEAKGLLESLLDENFGDNWSRWQAKVDQWVKDYSD